MDPPSRQRRKLDVVDLTEVDESQKIEKEDYNSDEDLFEFRSMPDDESLENAPMTLDFQLSSPRTVSQKVPQKSSSCTRKTSFQRQLERQRSSKSELSNPELLFPNRIEQSENSQPEAMLFTDQSASPSPSARSPAVVRENCAALELLTPPPPNEWQSIQSVSPPAQSPQHTQSQQEAMGWLTSVLFEQDDLSTTSSPLQEIQKAPQEIQKDVTDDELQIRMSDLYAMEERRQRALRAEEKLAKEHAILKEHQALFEKRRQRGPRVLPFK